MKPLRVKFLLILGVVLVCLYGVIGLPRNKAELLANWENNIHLGLDLRGGTYLVIQVQQQDAFNSNAGTVAERLKDAMRKAQVPVSDVAVDEAKNLAEAQNVAIVVKGVPAAQAGTFRSV